MKYEYWFDCLSISTSKKKDLIQKFKSAKEIYELPAKAYNTIGQWNEKDMTKVIEAKKEWNLEKEWELLEKQNIRFIMSNEPEYPVRLKQINDYPYALYVKGEIPKNEQKSIAIVGARKCSEYGYYMARKLGEAFGHHGINVISGLADGIDFAGHRGTLDGGGKTFAILGSGVDICYPRGNRELYEEIYKNGGILSEYPPKTAPRNYYFPARNRIISALADIIIVIEAKQKSGSLITADFALEQGKDVYALPGRVTDALSYGCNRLIKQGAEIIISVEDFLEDMNIYSKRKENFSKNTKELLAKEETLVYSCLGLESKSIEDILEETMLEMPCVAGILMKLQIQGIVKESFKNHYIKTE